MLIHAGGESHTARKTLSSLYIRMACSKRISTPTQVIIILKLYLKLSAGIAM